jgi:predicted ATPase
VITRIQLSDFKAFRDLDIELRPLTLLLGPNNTGKSSILAPIRLLAQTLAAGDPSVALLLDGPFGDFGTFRDVVFGNRSSSSSFRIRLAGTGRALYDEDEQWSIDAKFGYRSRRRQLVLLEVSIGDRNGHMLTATYVPESDGHVISAVRGEVIPGKFRGTSARAIVLRNFLPELRIYGQRVNLERLGGGVLSKEQWTDLDFQIDNINYAIRQELLGVDYIGGMRVPPERTYHQTGEGRAKIGAAGENWTGLLVLDSSRGGAGSRKMQQHLANWLHRAGLASEVRLNWLSDRHYEVQIRHPVSREIENLADVGQGNSQVIPVLLGGFRLAQDSLYMVEEPEIHLHPNAQAELGEFFTALCRTGINSLIETHSEHLVLRIQQHVASGEIDPNAVAFYYTTASKKGEKHVRMLTLDSSARFEQQLDGGFFPQGLEEAKRLARIRTAAQNGDE